MNERNNKSAFPISSGKKISISITLDEYLLNKVKKDAKNNNLKKSQAINAIIKKYYEDQEGDDE